jgi:GNAT superfamily N-acetyltransferase
MRAASQLVSASNENFVASYRTLVHHSPGGEARTIGGVFAFITGLPISLFNGCIVLEPSTPGELDTALAWVGGSGVPHRVFVAPGLEAAVGLVPLTHGLRRDSEPYPGMVLHPAPDSPQPAAGVSVTEVDTSGLEEHLDVRVAAGLSRSVAQRLFSHSFASDPDVRFLIGRLDGRAVGASVALRSAEACGIYAVETLADARRRGVGTALTWAAVAAGRAWGYDTIVLQSSAMAASMYTSMGFRTLVSYTTFST